MENPILAMTYEGSGLRNWVQTQLPGRNGQVLSGAISLEAFVCELNSLLQGLPDPTILSLDDCKRQLVILGMIGSSVERHAQQMGMSAGQGTQLLSTPIGSFSRYVATLTARVGGPARDSFLSYVIWNVPSVSIYLPGSEQPCFTLPGLFPNSSAPLTFSEDSSEANFLFLLKRCATLEAAANQALGAILQLDLPLDRKGALRHIEVAILLLRATREEILTFMQCPEFSTPFFLDGLRQYACPWDSAEIYSPPNAAHDYHSIVRDYLLGTTTENYARHVAALFHVLDNGAQQELDTARTTLTLATRIAWQLDVDSLDDLETYSTDDLRHITRCYPWISAYYRLYKANAELSATHCALVVIVGRHQRSTPIWMPQMERLPRNRKLHPLQSLKEFVTAQTLEISSEQLLTLARN